MMNPSPIVWVYGNLLALSANICEAGSKPCLVAIARVHQNIRFVVFKLVCQSLAVVPNRRASGVLLWVLVKLDLNWTLGSGTVFCYLALTPEQSMVTARFWKPLDRELNVVEDVLVLLSSPLGRFLMSQVKPSGSLGISSRVDIWGRPLERVVGFETALPTPSRVAKMTELTSSLIMRCLR